MPANGEVGAADAPQPNSATTVADTTVFAIDAANDIVQTPELAPNRRPVATLKAGESSGNFDPA
jgi:hypothetical protein